MWPLIDILKKEHLTRWHFGYFSHAAGANTGPGPNRLFFRLASDGIGITQCGAVFNHDNEGTFSGRYKPTAISFITQHGYMSP
jgi:hypothetical protein